MGDTSVQAPTLEIHRKQRLPTDTAEETETRLGACPSAVLESRIHAFIYNVYTFHVLLKSIQFCCSHAWKKSTSLDMSCANKNQPLSSRTHSIYLILIVGSLPLAKNAKHSPSYYTNLYTHTLAHTPPSHHACAYAYVPST